MGFKPFHCSHARHRGSDILQTLFTEILHSHVLLKRIQGHPRIHLGVAIGREGVVCATGIITYGDRRPGAQENAAGVNNVLDPVFGVSSVDDEVLWSISAK